MRVADRARLAALLDVRGRGSADNQGSDRMGRKFIPNGDLDFVTVAENFARQVADDPARLAVSREDADALTTAVARLREALQAARYGGRSESATRAKDDARADAER